jgi:hypothetical protein
MDFQLDFPIRGELECVRQKVQHHLLKPLLANPNCVRSGRNDMDREAKTIVVS